MIEKVITGGQTGADLAGWRAAKRFAIVTGGWMPKGWLTEDGPRPEFAELYGASEYRTASHAERTTANVYSADALVWFGNCHSSGGKRTLSDCLGANIDQYVVFRPSYRGGEGEPALEDWIREHTAVGEVRVLMIAGNRESSAPGIGEWVEAYLCDVFRALGFVEQGGGG